MGKEDSGSFLFNKDGKINLAFILSFVLIFIMMLWMVNATVTISLTTPLSKTLPGNMTYNGSRAMNFTFNVTWVGGENLGNCTLWTNHTGTWAAAKTNGSEDSVANFSISTINYTFNVDGNISWNIGCENETSATRNLSFTSRNSTFFIDTVAPEVAAESPIGTVLTNAPLNITSYETAIFVVNVTDNTTRNAVVIFSNFVSTLSGDKNSSNFTMTLNNSAIGDAKRQFIFNLSPILNFTSNFTGPGIHSVTFCANDSIGRLTCTGRKDFVITGGNVTQIENSFAGLTYQNPDTGSPSPFSFDSFNMTYGNGSDIEENSFISPLSINFSFIINFSNSRSKIYIVGARIDEAQFGNASRTNYSVEASTTFRQGVGTGFKPNITFVDLRSFIPSEVSYQFGILQMPGTGFDKKMYCNGTSITDPGCFRIDKCNSTNFNIFNHSRVIPPNSACWLETGTWGVDPLNSILTAGFTYIFVDKFSGGAGGNDTTAPGINFTGPAQIENGIFNTSVSGVTKLNFTVFDTNGTGLNLTANRTINLSIFIGVNVDKFFVYTNQSDITNLTCTTADTVSPGNTTTVTCNTSYSFNQNGTYFINVSARDTSNNTNLNSSMIRFTLDQIPPVINRFNLTHNASLELNVSSPGTPALGLGDGVSTAQGRTIHAKSNWTDNLTLVFQGRFQFYNTTNGAWQTLNDSLANERIHNETNWANFSFPIPTGHNVFEGRNISFRIVVNDTVGNVNTSNEINSTLNFTIQINDTTLPTITINGTLTVNGTAITDTTPRVSWNIEEGSALRFINATIDANTHGSTGVDSNCGLSALYYDTTSGANNVQNFRNSSFEVVNDPSCTLANGVHFFNVTATDAWGNSVRLGHTFTVQSGTAPRLVFGNLTNSGGVVAWSKGAVNESNITSRTGLMFYGENGAGATVVNLTYVSSCNSSATIIFSNATTIFPFNSTVDTSCGTESENRTLTVTATDTAGNSNTSLFRFLVDNVAPTLTANRPTGGESFSNIEAVINLSILDDDQPISHIGYYLDGETLFTLNISGAIGREGLTTAAFNTTNFTSGTHTIKFTVNDTMGNTRNSSVIEFTQISVVDLTGANATIGRNNLGNITNLTFYTSAGNVLAGSQNVGQTIKMFISTNGTTVTPINITFNFNGSAANWNRTNEIFPRLNDTVTLVHLRNNQTTNVISYIFINSSIAKFLPNNNSYFGQVRLQMNATANLLDAASGTLRILYFSDETDLASQTVVNECSASLTLTHSLTSGLPCWNNTDNRSVDVFVPHFSSIALVNDTVAPTVNVTRPASNQTIGAFVPNITVSSDAILCVYSINGTGANRSMTKSGTICTGPLESFKNLAANTEYNMTFTVNDSFGNTNTYIWEFNVSDFTPTNTPNSSRITVSESTTSATITLSGFNETVNANVSYGTAVGTLTSTSLETDFNTTQVVSLSSLSASTTYHFNVTVCDFNNNCAKNGTFNFTTSAAAAAAAAASSSSGSSGGGGGAVASVVSDSKAQVWSSVPAGSSFSLDVDKAGIAVTSVAVSDIKSELSNVELEVAALTKNPVSEEAASKVYQYLRITKKNLNNEDASFKVAFRVTKAWLADNSLASGDVALYRFADSKWNELATKATGTDSVYVNYEADTPGFSSFAVAVKSGVVAEEAPEEAEEAPVAAPEEGAPTPVERPTPVQAPGKAPVAWIIAAVVVILGIILIVMYQKKKQQG